MKIINSNLSPVKKRLKYDKKKINYSNLSTEKKESIINNTRKRRILLLSSNPYTEDLDYTDINIKESSLFVIGYRYFK